MVKSQDDKSSRPSGDETSVSSNSTYLTSLGVCVVVIALGFLSLDLYQRHKQGQRSTAVSFTQAQKPQDVLPKLQPKVTRKAKTKPTEQLKNSKQALAAKPTAPVAAPAKAASSQSASPKPAEPETSAPRFDIVRVEPDGTAVIAGRAAPGTNVEVMSDKTTIGTAKSNTRGEWAVVLEKPLKPGAHDLSIVASKPNSQVKQYSQQKVAVAVPQRRDEKPLVVLSRKDQPSKVLQQPKQPKQQAMPKGKLALKVVDYDTTGRIIFTGSATPGTTARIYVDNHFLRDASVDEAGAWELRANAEIAPGDHDLRIDELDKIGKVTARIQLPFTRAQPLDIAAINKVRNALKAASKAPQPPMPAPAKAQMAAKPAAPSGPVASVTTTPPAAPAIPAAPVAAPAAEKENSNTMPEQKITSARKQAPLLTSPAKTTVRESPRQAKTEPAAQQMPQKPANFAPEPKQQIAAVRKPKMRGFTASTTQAPQVKTPQAQVPGKLAAAPAQPKPQQQAAQQPAAPVQAQTVLSSGIVVQPGNNLWNISRVIYGQGAQYTVIYQANTDQIRDPDLIFPGQIFKTPGANPPRVISPDNRTPLTK